jgi:hypothetical protein
MGFLSPASGWMVGNPSVTRPNGQRGVRCGLPVIRRVHLFRYADCGTNP